MKHMNFRKNLNVAVWIGGTLVTTSALADMHQGGHDSGMMGGYGSGMMDGYGWIWMPILLVAIVGWIVAQKRK